MNSEYTYLSFLKDLLQAPYKSDRTGTGTHSIFGYMMRFDMKEGFPLFTTKHVPFKLVASELLWFIKGDTNIRYLLQNKNTIWNEWAIKRWFDSPEYTGPDMTNFGQRVKEDEHFRSVYKEVEASFIEKILTDDAFAKKYGDLGDIYGKQWRSWKATTGEEIDQLKEVIEEIKRNPDSRRLIINAWNPESVRSKKTALPPCHVMLQVYVNNGVLSGQLTQRSADAFLGSAFNIPSYVLLLMLIARECGLELGDFVYSIGDAHLYADHVKQAEEQISRKPYPLPKLVIKSNKSMFDLELEDFEIIGYQHHPAIKAPVAV